MPELDETQLWRILVHANDGSIYWETSRYTDSYSAHQILKNISHSYGGRPKVSHCTLYDEKEYEQYLESKK